MSEENKVDEVVTIEELRKCVGLTINEFDEDLKSLRDAAIKKLKLSGIVISKIKKEDSLIIETIKAYVRGNYRYTKQDIAEKFLAVFEENKNFMRSTKEYTQESKENG